MSKRQAEHSGGIMERVSLRTAKISFLLLIVCAILLVPALNAQTTGTLTGTVSDASGAVVPNARVTLKNEANADVRETVSNDVGRFVFAGVRPGSYTVRVTSENFKTFERTGFVINGGDTRDLSDLKLEVGSGGQTVTVSAETAQVQTVNNGEHAEVLSYKQIDNLTLISRNVSELLKIMPGVTSVASGQGSNGLGFDFSTTSSTGSAI